MDLCGPMRVESTNGKKYVLVIIDDYSRYTWTHFLRSKDETPRVLINFLTLVQRGLHAQVSTVRTDKGTKFLNKTLHAYFAKEGIRHETSTARTPEQNSVVERRNRTLIKAARTMLSTAKVPLDGENLDKMKEKGDACIFVRYSTQSKAYRVFNKRTRMIGETIHVNFDELPQMASDHVSSDTGPQCSTTVLEQDSLSPGSQSQENVPQIAETHGMTSCDSIGTPMATKYLDANLSGTPIDQMKYRSMVGELMYLTASRPDIVHATYSINMGLWYPKDTGFGVTAFLDSDHGAVSIRVEHPRWHQFLCSDKLAACQTKSKALHFNVFSRSRYVSLSACWGTSSMVEKLSSQIMASTLIKSPYEL
ncbi:uncharacterized mitochondrial protein-like protein [Tanacetum coccineum]